ncbi:MAG: hypothetical protein ABR913_08630 [Sedimentisphaerales bacterium]|jgi:DNA-binding beta-propeller fold protein YncE
MSSKFILVSFVVMCCCSALAFSAAISPGDIIVSDITANQIIKVDPTTGAHTVISSGGLLNDPWAVAVDRNKNIYVATINNTSNSIIKINSATKEQALLTSGGYITSSWAWLCSVSQKWNSQVCNLRNTIK